MATTGTKTAADGADDIKQRALAAHRAWHGKIEVTPRAEVNTPEDLAIAYTPGVAAPCLEIQRDPALSYTYTRRGNMVAVVTDGSAILGLGNIGPEAGMPVMEGKCVLFRRFAGIDAVPLCLATQDVDRIVATVKAIAPSFGGINLEDIAAPRCFEVERRLKEELDIPVFHDDQHGTAVVASAALINACRLTGRDLGQIRVVISGAGAAGISIAKLFGAIGVRNVVLVDRVGALAPGVAGMNPEQARMAQATNPDRLTGSLAEVMRGADAFVGVSAPGIVSREMVRSMAQDPIVFSLANPVPEIMPQEARAAGAAVVASGRSDFPNQINNVLVFPGVFRGALDARAHDVTDEMMVAAARAIAGLVSDAQLADDYIIPDCFDERVVPAVAQAVAERAR